MYDRIDFVTVIIILANIYVSRRGWMEYGFMERFFFQVDNVLIEKQWYRLITSGFLHLDVPHITMNMITLYLFGSILHSVMGIGWYVGSYLGAIVFGSLIALFFHRNHGDYSAAGASGGVSGVVFATIAIDPHSGVGSLFIPFYIPGWIYGILYLLYTMFSIKKQRDNVGHEAHLGGAMGGIIAATLFQPSIWLQYPVIIGSMMGMFIIFMFLAITQPALFIFPEAWILHKPQFRRKKQDSPTPLAARGKRPKPTDFLLHQTPAALSPEDELNELLDKVREKGMNGLSEKERLRLRELSEKM